jgi:GT2 family glycosyltransferase
MDCPKVSIIILNWNGKEDTIECLDSCKKITYSNYEIILVDNGSTDGSAEYFKNMYPEIRIIENGTNLGFAEGNNIALRWILANGTDYVLLLNNDTIVDPNFLSELMDVAKNTPEIGVVGPTVCYYNDVNRIQSAGAKIHWNKGKTTHFTDISTIDKIRDVDYIMGCALLAKSDLYTEIGLLNKNYFAYWEETDWCVRAHKAGYRIVHVPKSKIWHKGGSTSKKTSGFYEYHMARNMFWFMKQNATKKQYLSFLAYFFVFQFWLSTTAHVYHKNIQGYKSFLKGIIDGVKKNNQ